MTSRSSTEGRLVSGRLLAWWRCPRRHWIGLVRYSVRRQVAGGFVRAAQGEWLADVRALAAGGGELREPKG